MAFTCTLLILLLAVQQVCYANPINEDVPVTRRPLISADFPCTGEPLGMESGAIPDSSITASSTLSSSTSPQNARLNQGRDGWIPRTTKVVQWLQVDLGENTAITGVVVQGYPGGGYFVRTFRVKYSDTGEDDDWTSLDDEDGNDVIFNGNTGTGRAVTVTFPVTILARYLRIFPFTWQSQYHLKLEVLGCQGLEGTVRLVDGDGELEGRVEIYHGREWGTVCDNDWDMEEATTVCRQLGFWDALEAKKESFFGESDLPIVMNRVACKGAEGRLADCPFVCSSSPQCNSTNNAGVICKPNTIRLVGGSNSTNGRVEIYQGDEWGTICDNDWDITDANTVCKQLGFAEAEQAVSGAHFGEGQGPVYMDGLACDGSEDKITDCTCLCWGIKCDHTQDAGVVCRNRKLDDGVPVCAEAGPLGMKDGRIPDSSITASYDQGYNGARAHDGRLDNSGAWVPIGNSKQWIQVSFDVAMSINGLITQGSVNFNAWILEYEIRYSNDGQSWATVTDTDGTPTKFAGNTDPSNHVEVTFMTALYTRFIKIVPTECNGACALRFELIGCY